LGSSPREKNIFRDPHPLDKLYAITNFVTK
jgi:hypothetical protein